LHEQLLDLRGLVDETKQLALSKRIMMKLTSFVMQRTWLFAFAGRWARFMLPKLPRFMIYNRLNAWGKQREIPEAPKTSFRDYYRKHHGK
jgi:L-lactate dehydrogenase complex protein LldF